MLAGPFSKADRPLLLGLTSWQAKAADLERLECLEDLTAQGRRNKTFFWDTTKGIKMNGYVDAAREARLWEIMKKINPNFGGWESADSITSPDWCDSSSWPLGTDDSTWDIKAPDGKVLVLTRAIARFYRAAIHAGGDMLVEYFINDDEVVVATRAYKAWSDFIKRSSYSIHQKNEDASIGSPGDVWTCVLDFLSDGMPLVIWPVSHANGQRVVKARCRIADNVPYKGADGSEEGERWAYVRYPDCRIYAVPAE